MISKTEEDELKDASVFLYQLMNQENDEEMKKILEENENLSFLKANKSFSVKALSYPKEIDFIYTVKNLSIPIGFNNKKTIDPETSFSFNLYVNFGFIETKTKIFEDKLPKFDNILAI